jgi:hypothetical protein
MTMSRQHKYLVTTNAETGEIESVEQMGSAGELITVDPSTLLGSSVAPRRAVVQAQGEAAPGVFISPELPDVGNGDVETATPGVFFGGAEVPDVRTVDAATPGVFFHGAELPDVRAEAGAPGIFYHGPELPDVATQGC